MTFSEASAWLDHRANLERRMDPAAWTSIKLERVERLCELLGRPQDHGRTVHIAGSKGKGSTAALVAATLTAAGHRTGLYTSPHLVHLRERLQIDGEPIDEATFARLVGERLVPAEAAYNAEGHGDELSFFDLLTALAFVWFAEAQVDWIVLETGLGGRLDATNVCRPVVCAITTLSLEHTQFLGATIAEIAAEKAGIIKPGVPIVSACPQPAAAEEVLRATAAERGSRLIWASGVRGVRGGELVGGSRAHEGQRVTIEWDGQPLELTLPLLGAHQVGNAAVARTVLALTNAADGRAAVDRVAVVRGFQGVRWPGRLQIIDHRPWLVLDGAHTPDAAHALRAALDRFPHERRWVVVAGARDKNIAGLLSALTPGAAGLIVCGIPGNQRALAAEDLAAAAREAAPDLALEVAATPEDALDRARALAGADDLICVTGSLYLVGAVLAAHPETVDDPA